MIIFVLIFKESLCLVLLRPAETSLMLWLHGNGFIKRADLLALADIIQNNK